MRIFFIPGFGERPSIFDKIAPEIGGNQVFIDNWDLIGDTPRNWQVLDYAKLLIEKYQITENDVIIGHSMGGWIAYHIKHLVNCRIVQIASWTNYDRVVLMVQNHNLIYWLIRNGLYLNHFTKKFMIGKFYKGKASEAIFASVFEELIKGNKHNIINQLKLILTPVPEKPIFEPDLRIHAKADSIIRYPKVPCVTVSGDHFTLWTDPHEVYLPIKEFLTL